MIRKMKQLQKTLNEYFRKKDAISQSAFCKMAKVEDSTVSRLRSGERDDILVSTYEKINNALDKIN